jgi:hypothetical protein
MYHSRRMLAGYLGKLKAENTEDAKLLLEFADLLVAQRLSSNRVKKYLAYDCVISSIISRDNLPLFVECLDSTSPLCPMKNMHQG